VDRQTVVCKKDTLNSQPVSASPGLSHPIPLRLGVFAFLSSNSAGISTRDPRRAGSEAQTTLHQSRGGCPQGYRQSNCYFTQVRFAY
jgi:hypothetical protein